MGAPCLLWQPLPCCCGNGIPSAPDLTPPDRIGHAVAEPARSWLLPCRRHSQQSGRLAQRIAGKTGRMRRQGWRTCLHKPQVVVVDVRDYSYVWMELQERAVRFISLQNHDRASLNLLSLRPFRGKGSIKSCDMASHTDSWSKTLSCQRVSDHSRCRGLAVRARNGNQEILRCDGRQDVCPVENTRSDPPCSHEHGVVRANGG